MRVALPHDPAKIDWSVITPRDQQRQHRTQQIFQAGQAKTAADYYHGAMIFQHGKTVDDFATAHRLALRAAELDPSNSEAKWLAAATLERELMTRGKPQRYATQFKRVDGRGVLYNVDESVSDEERARWGVPSLAEAKQAVERLNAGSH